MKKYKHKLTGNIAVETNSENNYKVSEPRHFTIPKWVIENSSDWEEVVEKKYEIIEIHYLNENENTIIKYANGKAIYRNDNEKVDSTLTLTQFGETDWKKYITITSIKRLSDGEVFIIKDIVTMFDWNAKDCFIEKFVEHTNGKIGIVIKQQDTTSVYFNGLDTLQKVKRKPLFKTEDGVNIYENNIVYSVNKSFDLNRNVAGITVFNNCKVFSTKEAAKEYILMNKPCLSINEILDSITAKNAFKHKWLYDCKESVSILKDVVKEKNV